MRSPSKNNPAASHFQRHGRCEYPLFARSAAPSESTHVIERNGAEHRELIAFRDALRGDPELRGAYENTKEQILASGIIDSLDYSKAKESFITAILSQLVNP